MAKIETAVDAEVQLAQLDLRLGKGVGATKERAKLQSIIDGPPAAPEIIGGIKTERARKKRAGNPKGKKAKSHG